MKAGMDAEHNDYLAKILTAQVYDVAIESPLDLARLLSRRLDNRLFLKREDMQAVFSFATRRVQQNGPPGSGGTHAWGHAAASAGNHAQGVALAAHKLGCPAGSSCPSLHRASRSRRCRGWGRGDPAWGCIR